MKNLTKTKEKLGTTKTYPVYKTFEQKIQDIEENAEIN